MGLREGSGPRSRGRRTVRPLVLAVCAILLLSAARPSHAATTVVISLTDPDVAASCAMLGGSWDGSTTCSLSKGLTLGPADSVMVDPGAVLFVAAGATVASGGEIYDYGAINVGRGGAILNSGTITAYVANGTMTNDGSVENDVTGTISVVRDPQAPAGAGSFNFTNSGTLENLGTFVSYGNLTNSAEGSITNSGSISFWSATINLGAYSAPAASNNGNFTNSLGGVVAVNGATFNNTGAFTNAGTITEQQNVFSRINNAGTLSNSGEITNYGYLVNLGGTITNSGVINNTIGCTVVSCGTIANTGIVVNDLPGTIDNQGSFGNSNSNPRRPQLGSLTNYGTLVNDNLLLNDPGGTVANYGMFDNSGILTNLGLVSNSGSISSSGTVMNSGVVDNNSTASITNSRTFTNSGSINNLGTITDVCQGVFYGPGTVLGNPVATSATCSSTTTPAPEFPASMQAPVLLAAIVTASLAAKLLYGERTRPKRPGE
jgi:hypothetical protein